MRVKSQFRLDPTNRRGRLLCEWFALNQKPQWFHELMGVALSDSGHLQFKPIPNKS